MKKENDKMSLFIDALAKRIFYYMKYRDEEIDKLKIEVCNLNKQLNRGFQVCSIDHHFNEEIICECETCKYMSCEECADEGWIFMDIREQNEGYEGYVDTIITNDDEEFETLKCQHYNFCSSDCFVKYYNKPPVKGEIYTRYHSCLNADFLPCTSTVLCHKCGKIENGVECKKCTYRMCNECYTNIL